MEYTAYLKVEEKDTAAAMGSGDMPVLATPAMAALMENAAMNCVKDTLEEGVTTVGTALNLTHSRPSAIGAEIRATAVLEKQDGRAYYFKITAYDGENVIGEAEHTRVSVTRERFLAKLK